MKEDYLDKESDCSLIECAICHEVLNGKNLYIQSPTGKILCEKCQEECVDWVLDEIIDKENE